MFLASLSPPWWIRRRWATLLLCVYLCCSFASQHWFNRQMLEHERYIHVSFSTLSLFYILRMERSRFLECRNAGNGIIQTWAWVEKKFMRSGLFIHLLEIINLGRIYRNGRAYVTGKMFIYKPIKTRNEKRRPWIHFHRCFIFFSLLTILK